MPGWLLFAFAYLWPVTAGDLRSQVQGVLVPYCWTGPQVTAPQGCSGRFDADGDCDVDLRDLAEVYNLAGLPGETDVSPPSGTAGVTRCTMFECFTAGEATACWSTGGTRVASRK